VVVVKGAETSVGSPAARKLNLLPHEFYNVHSLLDRRYDLITT